MTTSTWVTILSASGTILAPFLAFWGVRYTQRSALKAQASAREIESQKVDAAAYAEARKIWDGVIDGLQAQVSLQTSQAERRDQQIERQNVLLDEFRSRLEDLEQKRAGDRKAIHVLTEYIRDLLALIKKNNLTPPPPPDGLDLER